MSPDILIIKALCNFQDWKRYVDITPLPKEDPLRGLRKAQNEFLETVGRDVSLEEFKSFYEAKNGSEEGLRILGELNEADIGHDTVKACLRTIAEREAANRIALACLDVVDGSKGYDVIGETIQKFSPDSEDDPEDPFVTDDLELLFVRSVQTPGLRWRMNVLNQSIGSLRKGNFGFLFARPETGKTTFLSSEATFMAAQTDRPILWFKCRPLT